MTLVQKIYKGQLLKVVMRKELLFVLGVFLVGFMTCVGASSSSTAWVNFTVHPNNGSDEDAFNGVVDGLEIEDRGYDWIYVVWENSEDERFSHNLVFVDRVLVGNTPGEFFNVTGLSEGVRYEISVIAISDEGDEGVRSAIFGRTLGDTDDDDDDDKDNKKKGKKTGMGSDVIPNFFVGEDGFASNNVTIALGSFSASEDRLNWVVLFWLGLGFFIFLLLVLIFVLLIRR